MNGIMEFLQSPLGQIVILVAVALIFGKNPQMLDWILETLKIQKPKPTVEQVSFSSEEVKVSETVLNKENPNRDHAFVAADVLINYFTGKEECKEGLAAAKVAGKCLFD